MQNTGNVRKSPPRKRKSSHFSVDDKVAILNTFRAYQREHPSKTKTELVKLTSEAEGVGVASVFKILREYKENNQVFQPPMRYHRQRSVLDNVTEEHKDGLRRLVQSLFVRNEPPTVLRIKMALEEQDELPCFKLTSLRRLLKEINFGAQATEEVKQELAEFLETPITIKEEPLGEDPLDIAPSTSNQYCDTEDWLQVKLEPDDDQDMDIVGPKIEDPGAYESITNDIERSPELDRATDSRGPDPIDLMFLDFAERFKQFSASMQLVVRDKICQIFADAETDEIRSRKQ